MLSGLKIHIIGGTGQMGNWLRNFLESMNLTVTVSGRNPESSKPIAHADIVFISVPISLAKQVIGETIKIVKKDCLLIDLSSVKTETSKVLREAKLPSAGLHLLFGPTVASSRNQKIILCRIIDHPLINRIKELFEKEGSVVIDMSPEEHDRQMAYVQALIHFSNLNLAKTLIDAKIDLNNHVSTPVFVSQTSVISRVLSQNPELLAEIQLYNPFVPEMINRFINIQMDFLKKIKNKRESELIKEYTNLHNNLESSRKKITKHKSEKQIPFKNIGIRDCRIAFLGPKGTFSHTAALEIFKHPSNRLIPQQTIYEIFESVAENTAEYGVVPAENSNEGTVHETLDLLVNMNLKTNMSFELPVHQNLLSASEKLSQIKKVISHPQALAQCKDWLKNNLPNVEIEKSSSTLSSVPQLKKDKSLAIIGSKTAAKLYELNILNKNIEDNTQNITKFYVISKNIKPFSVKTNKTLLFLSIFNRVGILKDILEIFASSNINLSKLESRPSKERVWDYYFFIEAEISIDDPKLVQIINLLKQYCPEIKVLGGV